MPMTSSTQNQSSSDSTSESILDELEAIDLGMVEIVVERVTVVKFRMDYGSGNEVAMVEAVLKSIKGRMRRRSRKW
jgi:hypothetical protein